MPKRNPYLTVLEARYERMMAAMLIAAGQALGCGSVLAKKLGDAFDQVFEEYAVMVNEDAQNDRQLWYTKEKLDRALKIVCREHFVPREERYK